MGRKKLCIFFVAALVIMGLTGSSVYAGSYTVAGNELNLLGYITQNVSYGVHKDYNTEHGFNGLLTNIFIEADYRFADTAKFYVSGLYTADWIYAVKREDAAWNHKLFNQSAWHGNKLYMDIKYWQLLKEAHITWNPQNFLFRFGKQIVVWGEMDAFRLMDQINPLDSRRGFADVEFETSVIPIWLAVGEYQPKVNTSWLTDLVFQFVFNPNVTFIPDQNPTTGNDLAGIWAVQAYAGPLHVGSQTLFIDRPKAFSDDGFSYAFRIKGNILGSAISLNYYYGREKDPATIRVGITPFTIASDGIPILHFSPAGLLPAFSFCGCHILPRHPFPAGNALGGVAPLVRLESIYAFSNTFAVMNPVTNFPRFIHSDDFRFGHWRRLEGEDPRAESKGILHDHPPNSTIGESCLTRP